MKKPRIRQNKILPVSGVLWLIVGAVVVPAVLSVAVGIVALALSGRAFDIVLGVLVLCFAVMCIGGGIIVLALLRRSERLAQLQTDFVANMSHELRTPLAGIRLLAETLHKGRAETPEHRQEVLDLLLEQSSRLEDAVRRILRWRRLEVGREQFYLMPLAVDDLLDEALKPFSAAWQGTRVAFSLDVQPDLPFVLADRDGLLDVLRNLLDNAVKFGGDQGPVEITARGYGSDVQIEVRDQGPGIPRADQRHIFERFYRVSVHLRSKQGTGLGLSIARSIMEAHGGEIGVESEPGIGSAFWIRLPAAPQEENAEHHPWGESSHTNDVQTTRQGEVARLSEHAPPS